MPELTEQRRMTKLERAVRTFLKEGHSRHSYFFAGHKVFCTGCGETNPNLMFPEDKHAPKCPQLACERAYTYIQKILEANKWPS